MNKKLIIFENAKELGLKVYNQLNETDCLVKIDNVRFANGEGKVKIKEDISKKDLYVISDIGNYNIYYQLRGQKHYMSPDEHYQDIKRLINATSGYANKVTLIMPLLYQSRQHRRNGYESLDCAMALQELQNLGVNKIITFDVHDYNVSSAICNLPFENLFPTKLIINEILKKEKIENPLVISPDMGAIDRAKDYAKILNCDVGIFHKRRDLTKVINGKNPIVEHIYMGSEIINKDILIIDDMICSGESMLETAKILKEKGARKIFLITTFPLLTEGINKFNEAYKNNYFNKLYTTNLTYVDEKIKLENWYYEVDCSKQIAELINNN